MKTKTPQQVGKDFEEATRLVMKALTLKIPCMFHRLYDTHSAGAFLPEQPADFLFMHRGKLVLIECKSSAKHSSLSSGLSSLMEKEKAPLIRMWLRAGAKCLFLFLDQTTGDVEFWNGADVIEARSAERGRLKTPCRLLRAGPEDYEGNLRAMLIIGQNYS